MTETGNRIVGRFHTHGFVSGAILQLASIAVVWFEVQRRLIPAVARDVSFATFYTAARLFVDTPNELPNIYSNDWFNDQIHRHGFPQLNDVYFGNPPTMGAMLTPLALMPVAAGRVVWAVVNVAALVGGVATLLRALRIPLRWTAPLVALAVLTAPVGRHFERNQLYLLLFGCLCVLIAAWLGGRRRWAGVALGVMLTFKTAGAWLLLTRLARRDWALVGGALASASILVVGLLPVTGIDVWRTYVSILPQLGTMPMRYVTAYQTLVGFVGHLFVYDGRWNPNPLADLPLVAGIVGPIIFLTSLVISLRREPSAAPRSARALHVAMLLSLVVTNTPFAEDYHYVLVLPSLLIAWWWLTRNPQGRHWMMWLIAATIALVAPLPYKHPMLANGALAVFAYPRV